jgi:tetraacyldisaccharide 4'-kinase
VLTPGQRPIWWLSWPSALYALAIRLRTYGYERGWFARQRLPLPVISIGNLTVGGTGKTPMVIEVTQWLLAAGSRVAVLSRGYRRTSREPFLLVCDGAKILATPQEAGDEPYLIAQRCPQAIVAVGADRHRAGLRVLNEFRVDCIVLDDGFQHIGLHRDADLVLLDATDANGLANLLPAGRLREPLTALERATAVIITRAETPGQVAEIMTRVQSLANPSVMTARVVFPAVETVSLSSLGSRPREWSQGKRALLVSGVGHPASFRATADQLGVTVLDEATYPDHYMYGTSDIAALRGRAAALKADVVLTTEKDAWKIRPHLGENDDRWWAVRVSVEWLTGEAEIRKTIMEARTGAQKEVGA